MPFRTSLQVPGTTSSPLRSETNCEASWTDSIDRLEGMHLRATVVALALSSLWSVAAQGTKQCEELREEPEHVARARRMGDCDTLLPADERSRVAKAIKENPVMIFAWAGCPCTNMARTRFARSDVCFRKDIWCARLPAI